VESEEVEDDKFEPNNRGRQSRDSNPVNAREEKCPVNPAHRCQHIIDATFKFASPTRRCRPKITAAWNNEQK